MLEQMQDRPLFKSNSEGGKERECENAVVVDCVCRCWCSEILTGWSLHVIVSPRHKTAEGSGGK